MVFNLHMGLAHFTVQTHHTHSKTFSSTVCMYKHLFTTPPTPSTLTPSTPHTPSTLTQVYCGRYINQHMLTHKTECDHNVVLSLADLSVWCFTCDSYLDNQVDTLSPPSPEIICTCKTPLHSCNVDMPILVTLIKHRNKSPTLFSTPGFNEV